MSTPIYEQGTIKVVWIEDDPEEIYSRMFESEVEAEAFAQSKKDYLIFALIQQQDMRDFSWRLLPYGRADLYTKLFRNYKKYQGKVLETLAALIS
jgi:hypothetical protein